MSNVAQMVRAAFTTPVGNVIFALIGLFLIAPSFAEEPISAKEAEKRLKATFTNYQINDFRPSPIPGIYEVHAGPQIHYYVPEQELLIFGQIWSSVGENLTEKAKQESINSKLERLPLESAILVQKGSIPIIEIVNPDCGFCKQYEEWVGQIGNVYSIERQVVFLDSPMFPRATEKMRSVICASEQAEAYHQMMQNQHKTLSCAKAVSVLEEHTKITDSLGVQGTPSFLLPDGTVITGFRKRDLENYFMNAASNIEE